MNIKLVYIFLLNFIFFQFVNAQIYNPVGTWNCTDNSGSVHPIKVSSIEGGISIVDQLGQTFYLFTSGVNQYTNDQTGLTCSQTNSYSLSYGSTSSGQIYIYYKAEQNSNNQASTPQYRSQRQAEIADNGDILAQYARNKEQQSGNFSGQTRSRSGHYEQNNNVSNTSYGSSGNQNYYSSSNEKINSTPKSDIDKNIPDGITNNAKTFVVIIGNEKYKNEITVEYAKNDAHTFKEYVTKTLGVPEEQVHFREDATFGDMLSDIEWLTNVGKAFGNEANLMFYYAGHGMPDDVTKSAYLLPVDGSSSQMRTAIKIDDLYASLTKYPVKQATVFLDACFSGAARDGMLASGRGVAIKPKEGIVKGNLVVFTAVSGDQTAHPYSEKYHGLFSYFLMKKLQETKGNVSYKELSDYISKNVNQISVVKGKEQTPKVIISNDLYSKWQNWKFK